MLGKLKVVLWTVAPIQMIQNGYRTIVAVQIYALGEGGPEGTQGQAGSASVEVTPFFADVTGEVKADAIVLTDDGVMVRRSTRAVFSGNESWTTNPYYGSRGTFFADVTGDGKADAIVVNEDKVTVRRSTGAEFSGNESWTTNPYYGSRGTFFAGCDRGREG